jgi:hypothetical protein
MAATGLDHNDHDYDEADDDWRCAYVASDRDEADHHNDANRSSANERNVA